MQGREKLKILFVSAEVTPFAKTGGLADVAGSLPLSLASMGHDVRVVMPRYKQINADTKYTADFPVMMGWRNETCIVRESEINYKDGEKAGNIPAYFIDNYHYFYRDGIYCHYDDGERFAFFCNAVMDMLPAIGFQPDVIHCNDWHSGPICMLLKERYKNDQFYSNMATIYTIHNLQYQGHFSKDILKVFNVGDEVFTPEKTEFYGMFNFMKAGLVYADIINTVSETYAKEIQTEECGEKLEGLLKRRKDDLYGVVNGIDYNEFNPSRDYRIYRNFDIGNIDRKLDNKHALQKELGLPVGNIPVIGLISRLTGQKGLNLVEEVIDEMFKNDMQFVLLGTGDDYYENTFKNIRMKYPDKMGVFIGFNAELAQRIYAGSDMFLMPSRFEPCGLGQIISLRYGTIPVVRATGGLAETVVDVDESTEGNGFSFSEFSSKEMLDTINRALKLYNEKPDQWKRLVERAMSQDFSWDRSAKKYEELYYLAIRKSLA